MKWAIVKTIHSSSSGDNAFKIYCLVLFMYLVFYLCQYTQFVLSGSAGDPEDVPARAEGAEPELGQPRPSGGPQPHAGVYILLR